MERLGKVLANSERCPGDEDQSEYLEQYQVPEACIETSESCILIDYNDRSPFPIWYFPDQGK